MALLNCFAELVQNKFLLDCICLFGGGGGGMGQGENKSLHIEGKRRGIKGKLNFESIAVLMTLGCIFILCKLF